MLSIDNVQKNVQESQLLTVCWLHRCGTHLDRDLTCVGVQMHVCIHGYVSGWMHAEDWKIKLGSKPTIIYSRSFISELCAACLPIISRPSQLWGLDSEGIEGEEARLGLGIYLMIQCLPSVPKALDLIPSITEKDDDRSKEGNGRKRRSWEGKGKGRKGQESGRRKEAWYNMGTVSNAADCRKFLEGWFNQQTEISSQG